ncbi:trypco2 family protein [Streptomyces sp. NPDC003691]
MDIPLAAAVAAVRDELVSAAAVVGEHPNLVFAVGPVEMEFAVEIRADAKATGRFSLWAVGADTEAGVSRGRTHRVSFTLTPRDARGGDVLVAGAQDRPSGAGDNGERVED